ncbi:MAG: thiamine diphosphokinase [Muribaculaceae bacterium]|nr:thiamine diphosphokinase [Roseburia sp.]MCM1430292.1 thiamine diphosphokinase [Muribaculaceae bacterium]MCM1492599.1 thiamine diphosphokinase [Muribaculaceae bacterium]
MKYLIVTGGEIPDEFAAKVVMMGGFEVIMAADVGMEFLYRAKIQPDIIVGDFDSADPEILDYFRSQEQIDICMLPSEKDDTDTEFAIREAISRGAREITILGATGTRLDHVLGNIALLGIGLESDVRIELLDPYNRIRMIDRPFTLRKDEQYGKYLSLISFSDQVTGVSITGVKYPLSDYTMGGFNSLGVSNEIVDEEATISLTSGRLLMVESRD